MGYCLNITHEKCFYFGRIIYLQAIFNHLIKSNHIILAHKILSNIKNKTPINLTDGVMKNVITKDLLEDESFMIEELFDSWTKSLYSLNLNNPAEVNEIFK